MRARADVKQYVTLASSCGECVLFLQFPFLCWCSLQQDAGLKVKEYELIRKNFSDSGNFGKFLC